MCNDSCLVEYHVHCWKKLKSEYSEKSTDKVNVVLCCAVLCCAVLCCMCCVVLCCVVLCCAVLFCVALCCVVAL